MALDLGLEGYMLGRPLRRRVMASNIAQRRAAKAAQRKQALRARRAAAPISLADRVQRFASCPLYRCMVQPEMFESGIGMVILARQAETGEIATAIFLVDAFSLGIKDAVFQLLEPSEFDFIVTTMSEAAPFRPVDASYARKLLRDAAAYAASLGLRPHRGFAAIARLFGDTRAEDCPAEFSFGYRGRPYYVAGPIESTDQIARRLGRLTEQLGPDGFDFMVPLSDELCITNQGAEPVPAAEPARAASES